MAIKATWNSRRIEPGTDDLGRRVTADLRQVGERAIKGVSQDIHAGADVIAETASAYAPFAAPWLKHNAGSANPEEHLDHAIEVKQIDDPNRRLALRVFVNGQAIGHDGKPIGRYAWLMHEGINVQKWSESTLDKPGAGPQYLLRAFDENVDMIKRAAEARARKVFGK